MPGRDGTGVLGQLLWLADLPDGGQRGVRVGGCSSLVRPPGVVRGAELSRPPQGDADQQGHDDREHEGVVEALHRVPPEPAPILAVWR